MPWYLADKFTRFMLMPQMAPCYLCSLPSSVFLYLCAVWLFGLARCYLWCRFTTWLKAARVTLATNCSKDENQENQDESILLKLYLNAQDLINLHALFCSNVCIYPFVTEAESLARKTMREICCGNWLTRNATFLIRQTRMSENIN